MKHHSVGFIFAEYASNVLSKIFVEYQDSGFDAIEATHEEIVPAMVEQRNHFSNKIHDFQALIEELKNQILIARQHFE